MSISLPSLRGSSAPSFEALLERPGLVWMGQNTTHLEPPPQVTAALELSVERREFQLYAPAAGFERLRSQILADLALAGSDCWITDGAVGGLHHVVTALAPKLDLVITSDPGWPWPGRFASVAGVRVETLPVYEQPRRLLSVDQIASVIEERSLIYLIDPLNPLGSSYTREELAAITTLARDSGAYVIHDATYRHFADAHTLAAELYPERTVTTYSFSKWLGLAGLRVGAIVAAPELLAELTAVPSNPLGAGILSQRAAMAGLQVRAPWLEHLRAVTRRNLEAIEGVVRATDWAEVVVPRSQGNFLAIDVSRSGWSAESLCEAMLDHGVFIRPGTYQSPRFGKRFVKVSASVPVNWVDRFLEVWSADIARGPATS